MLKKGFTLQETLITLAIIGIVAAVTVPRLAKIAPDRNHASYIKAHAILTDLTNEMLVDPALYFCNDGTEGLACTNMPKRGTIPADLFDTLNSIGQLGQLTQLRKYFEIFAYKMHIQESYLIEGGALAFRAKDGVVWIFAQVNDNNPILVDIDMDGISNNDISSEDNNDNTPNRIIPDRIPDRFSFNVALDGTISAADAMGQFYLENATDVNSKNAEKLKMLQKYEVNNNKYRSKLNVSHACSNNGGQSICF